ncbi:unnamed protein product [Cuscuta epithymum]|uniref:Uncharacterized protein n=1 Tax=Cuscuta epithymum TaxID=186058 RepID=A0AAV0FX37_9ASTE|nr:unnamed protein product [Cuscuta epithymum]
MADKISSENMDAVETKSDEVVAAENGVGKRPREEKDMPENDDNGEALKKTKVQNSEEVKKVGLLDWKKGADGETKEVISGPVTVGPKTFGSSTEMFDYFHRLLHSWSVNLNLNKYEEIVLMELLKKGHAEPEKKIGSGVDGFQVRYHPVFKSRCFFILREDGSTDDFSFRKCVDNILPLPENMATKSKGEHGGGGGRWGGRGRGRGRGKWRN